MGRRSVSRRRFLAGAGASGIAVALSAPASDSARDVALAQAGGGVSAETVRQIAAYAELPLPADSAERIVAQLGGPLATLRGLEPTGYDDLLPAHIFIVPRGD
jgi:hypothetical protein